MAGKKELIVVYKDEYAVDCFRKLVDAMNEEAGEGGEEITLLALSEKSWDLKKKNPPVTGKTIFIGAIKDMDALLCFIDTKYERWGIKYGYNSRYACIIADTVFVKDKARYEAFLRDFDPAAEEPVPLSSSTAVAVDVTPTAEERKKAAGKFLGQAGLALVTGGASIAAQKAWDYNKDLNEKQHHLYFSAAMHFLANCLEDFLNS